ncbi:MAG: ABC transporter permease [Chloroflexota bacterium]
MGASSVSTLNVASEQQLDVSRSTLRGRLQYALSTLRRSPVGVIGGVIVIFVLLCAAFGPMIAPFDATEHNLRARFMPPGFADDNGTYILGTDQLGRDILSRVIMGSRISVTVGVAAVVIAGTIGLLYGILAGFVGGWLDALLMRIADALLAIPFIILAVAVSGVVGPSLLTLILVLGFTGWVTYARVARSEVLVVRELDYVVAARVIGQPTNRIMVKHILPNVLASAIVLAALQVGVTILAESSLSFLGLGVQPPTVTWGLMLADGRQYLGSAWWMATFPGIAITITVLGVVFLGDWVRDVLDPRLRE